jgi:hypothetical protein
MRSRIVGAAVSVLAVCIAVRIGSAVVGPALPELFSLLFVGGILFWLIGRR